ncbi:MAG: TAXI family TRAP transporter solute-binding subunit [Deltaproteobacteria bacterium]|nr:TAXI family TRAP transporter solute-binding subunit [Deltaproteobacteria bacterium]MBW1920537.1 TAXI family TRAP transporter solute-binding subunit [Deltaproteobacteria bacterium]MBW1931480.1 TAXI family TRAP transporter solute-binding subunit [Deltaproteobacteria bacterium]MBW1976712.1 TAXI family TRAP transporter solute-binding subunit [Deltaproteobacteria bacterium]MBW2044819.1 TAXI family TRAP transporter solute-binding subunit [Deltaproteobacteria bacterium]
MKKGYVFVVVLVAGFMLTTASWAKTVNLSLSTGSMGGGFYAIGGGMAEYITKHVQGVRCTAVTSGGVDENINRLDTGKADIGLVSTGDSQAAFKGMPPYKKKFNKMRGMGILFANWGEPYTLKKSGIKTYLDLKGKTVCVGAPGGSMHKLFFDWVRIHGLDPEKDMKIVFLPARGAVDALKTGQIDAAMQIAAIPTADITELSLTHDVEIIRFAPGYREKLIKKMPKYLPMVIPAGTYRGINEDIETVGMAALWACRADLPDDLVYRIVKAMYSPQGLAYLAKVHPAGKGIKLENAAKWAPIPFHPGAARFFREKGLLK